MGVADLLWVDRTDKYHISRKAEDKLIYKLTNIATERCKQYIDTYNDCLRGRTVSSLWACREKHKASQDCLHILVNDENVDIMKRRWVDAGKPTRPNWEELMKGIVD